MATSEKAEVLVSEDESQCVFETDKGRWLIVGVDDEGRLGLTKSNDRPDGFDSRRLVKRVDVSELLDAQRKLSRVQQAVHKAAKCIMLDLEADLDDELGAAVVCDASDEV